MGWLKKITGNEQKPAPPPKAGDTARKVRASADTHLRRGVEKIKGGDTQAAIAAFTRAIEADPSCAQAWANRGVARERAGDIAGAKADYSKSIEIEFNKGLERETSE